MYAVSVANCNIAPSEYWKMTGSEVMEILEIHRPKVINGIHEDDHEEMYLRRLKLEEQGYEVL